MEKTEASMYSFEDDLIYTERCVLEAIRTAASAGNISDADSWVEILKALIYMEEE